MFIIILQNHGFPAIFPGIIEGERPCKGGAALTLEEFNGQLWPLLPQIHDSINALLRPVCDRPGLTPIQLPALLALTPQPCTAGELRPIICMADTNVSALCKRLERRGLLRRVRGGAGSGGLPAPLKILRAKIPRQSRRFAMRRLSPTTV